MNRILILDYGSQFTQLIARRVREARVYCEIHPAARGTDLEFVTQFDPKGLTLPGGPNSLFEICRCTPDWTPGHFIEHEVQRIQALVSPAQRAICGLSGGVDSAVAAALVHRAIGDRLTCIFVDHGLLRLNEREQVERTFRAHLGLDLRVV